MCSINVGYFWAAVAEVTPYGFIKASYLRADKTQNNYKPFYALEKPAAGYSKVQKATQSQFSAKQSRFGLKANNGSKVFWKDGV